MTNQRTALLRTLLAILVASLVTGCLPVGFRGSNLYTATAASPRA